MNNDLHDLKEALEQGLAKGRIRITSYEPGFKSHELTLELLKVLMASEVRR